MSRDLPEVRPLQRLIATLTLLGVVFLVASCGTVKKTWKKATNVVDSEYVIQVEKPPQESLVSLFFLLSLEGELSKAEVSSFDQLLGQSELQQKNLSEVVMLTPDHDAGTWERWDYDDVEQGKKVYATITITGMNLEIKVKRNLQVDHEQCSAGLIAKLRKPDGSGAWDAIWIDAADIDDDKLLTVGFRPDGLSSKRE